MDKYHGNTPGDMSPTTKDYQVKRSSFAGDQEGKTTEYISRNDRRIDKQGADIRKQGYKGRYD